MNRRTDLVNIGHPSTDDLYCQYVDDLNHEECDCPVCST